MGDHEHRSALHERIHAPLNDGFRARVDGRCRLVENHHRRVGDRGARNRFFSFFVGLLSQWRVPNLFCLLDEISPYVKRDQFLELLACGAEMM